MGCFVETFAQLNLPRLAEVEVRFTACGTRLAALARVMEVHPGEGAGFEFLQGDPRLDQVFFNVIERLKARESNKVQTVTTQVGVLNKR